DNAQKVRQLEHKITIQAKEDREQRQALREAHEMKVKVLELEHKASVKEMEEKHEAALAAVRSDALNNAQRDLQIITTQQKKLNEWQTCHESWVACAGKADAEMDKLRATVKEKDAELAKVRKEAAEEVEKANWARDKALAEKVAMRQKLEEMTEAMQKSVLDPGDKKPAQVGPKLISVLNLLFHALNLEEAAAAAGSEKKAPAKKSAEAKDMRVTTFSQPVYSFLLLLGQDDFAKQLTLIAGKSKEAPDLQEVKEEEEPGPAKKDRKKAAAEPAKKPEKEDRKKAAAEPAKKPEKEDRKKAAAEPAKKPEKEDRKQGAAGPAKKPEEEAAKKAAQGSKRKGDEKESDKKPDTGKKPKLISEDIREPDKTTK
ncbi:unnamed protein product, partial [Symbiodinium pilosum]